MPSGSSRSVAPCDCRRVLPVTLSHSPRYGERPVVVTPKDGSPLRQRDTHRLNGHPGLARVGGERDVNLNEDTTRVGGPTPRLRRGGPGRDRTGPWWSPISPRSTQPTFPSTPGRWSWTGVHSEDGLGLPPGHEVQTLPGLRSLRRRRTGRPGGRRGAPGARRPSVDAVHVPLPKAGRGMWTPEHRAGTRSDGKGRDGRILKR